MKCDECGKPNAKKYFVSWLCKEHGDKLLISVGWKKEPVVLSIPCECDCHKKEPLYWCDTCWTKPNHGKQISPLPKEQKGFEPVITLNHQRGNG